MPIDVPPHGQRYLSVAQIHDKYDLRSEFERYFPHNVKSGRLDNYLNCICPFHNDHSPSMVIYETWMECKGCGAKGDILDFTQLRLNCSFNEARATLSDGEYVGNVVINRDQKAIVARPPIPLEKVMNGFAHHNEALPFFDSRAISPKIASKHMLGMWPEYNTAYTDLANYTYNFKAPRYTVPNLVWDEATGDMLALYIKLRRDDTYCLKQLERYNGMREHFRSDLALKWDVPVEHITDGNILDEVYGVKYTQVKNPRASIFNMQRCVRIAHWKFTPRKLGHIFITEGELDALALESAGYPAVCAKVQNGIDFRRIFYDVSHVYIIADRDPDKQDRNGEWYNPGMDNARRMRSALDRRYGTSIILPPEGFKDSNDVAVAGELGRWLYRDYKIEPTLI